MKSGSLIVFGIIVWIVTQMWLETYWIHQFFVSYVALLISTGASFYWLTIKQNRQLLFVFVKAKNGSDLVEAFKSGFFINMAAGFLIVCLFIQIGKYSITKLEGFELLVQDIQMNSDMTNQLGQIRHVEVGRSFNYRNKNSKKTLKGELIVFGSNGSKTLKVFAERRSDGVWEFKY